MSDVQVLHGDALAVLPTLDAASVDAVVTDPPYGLEFMGREWDGANGFRRSLNPADVERESVFGRTSRTSPEYRTSAAKAGMSPTGYTDGAERLDRPSHLGGLNPKCRKCDRWQRGGNPCTCDEPDFPNERLPRLHTYQQWCEAWAAECLRLLKPGGHLLAFGGSRTFHRLACAVEDAGFEIRDTISWLYASGFPKSLDVSKAIDRAAGAEREVVGNTSETSGRTIGRGTSAGYHGDIISGHVRDITTPATDDARRWQGWGTALKPAWEPVIVARKPLAGTVASNVLAHGTAALNIDGCRVEGDGDTARPQGKDIRGGQWSGNGGRSELTTGGGTGRWPANVALDEDAAAELDRQSGTSESRIGKPRGAAAGDGWGMTATGSEYADSGGASRFYFTAKAAPDERPRVNGVAHPTVKPLDLMRWLVRLVTPPGGLVLDPFAGSGTTGEACLIEGFRCVLVEREDTYLPLIRARLDKPIQPVIGMPP